ncbi:unnamed protein product [Amoebophrya sp. A120]|nr:unnamed protein product [Amoebophrya sp. A120]|eukprot:GSA120T00000653001.1
MNLSSSSRTSTFVSHSFSVRSCLLLSQHSSLMSCMCAKRNSNLCLFVQQLELELSTPSYNCSLLPSVYGFVS